MVEKFGSKEAGKKGGKARAEKLSPEQRKKIARKAAESRWAGRLPRATHDGELKIGDLTIPCAVLDDGTRILTQEGFLKAIGRSGKPAKGRGSQVEKIAPFLDLNNLKPFVSQELANSTKPVVFQVPKGTRAYGYRADLLPKVCEVYLRARDDEALLKSQYKMAAACDILMRALAHVGIVALVDEATGFQYDRARRALEEILDAFIKDELGKWAKRFPDEFYEHLFRLKGKQWPPKNHKMPQHVGHWTNNLVYKRMAPGILDELREKTPRTRRGNRKHKYHQWLTDDVGHPKLQEHLSAVIALMKSCDDWEDFEKRLNKALPKYKSLPLFDDQEEEPDS